MRNISVALCLAAITLVGSTPALADDTFTLTGGADTITFSLPASPTPASSCAYLYGFCVDGVSVIADGTTYSDETVNFFTSANAGGLLISNATYSDTLVNLYDTQLFSGTVTDPTFIPGTYDLLSPQGDYNESFSLQISAPTPEPSGLVLLGTGILVLIAVARRRCLLA